MPQDDVLQAELRLSWTRKLVMWWQHYNELYLNDAMRLPVIRLGDGYATLGHWQSEQRILTISDVHIAHDSWLAVMDTLRHEMAHQYVDEVQRIHSESPHGKSFRLACEKLRCHPQARAREEDLADEATEDDRILRLLQKVLSLANSPNENEAQAAMQKAHQLLMKYNIDLVALDQQRRFEMRTLGEVKGRHTSAELWLGSLLGRFFFVEVLWGQSYEVHRDQLGTVMQVYGTPENLDMAVYVYDYLMRVLDDLWQTYRTEKQVASNRERQRYFAGVLAGFYQKLESQELVMEQTQALVWQGDEQLQAYFRYVNPNVRIRKGGGVRVTEAYRAGVQDGQSVVIHRPVADSGDGVRGLLE
ncbi:MAG: DUF2786 domain-containing protein [Candidatus Latescibacteria bacterium]|jgi:hypothetical protein|nr:DUF2786 domain-containing protein [Candidatus Latescibacterota bacterium]MBT5830117.1 DUF2786 domain-containing protein [Candidatus Latescibacterota bacterium]